MSLKLSKNALLQYVCIYIMLFVNQSSAFHNIYSSYALIIAVFFCFLIALKKRLDAYSIGFIALLFFFMYVVRIRTDGGVGIGAWAMWACMISTTYFTICLNRKMFIPRFIRLVYFLAIVSLICYLISLVSPEVLRNILTPYNNASYWRQWSNSTDYIAHSYKAYGLWFYVLNDNHITRNCGIFTEPGIYQMVLNTALFFLFFFENNLLIDSKKRSRMIVILSITLLSTQSTTGYLMFIVMIIGYLLKQNEFKDKIKGRIIFILVLVSLALVVDYNLRNQDSILAVSIFNKLFTETGQFSVAANSGDARTGTILICLASMFTHPLGVGYTRVHELLNVNETGYLAAQIFQTGAAMGIGVLLVMLIWVFYPIIKSKSTIMIKLLYVFMYFNTALAQSREFYPTLIMIPLWVYLYENWQYTLEGEQMGEDEYERLFVR